MRLLMDFLSPMLLTIFSKGLHFSEDTKADLKSLIFCLNGIFFLLFAYILANIGLYYYLMTMWDEIYVFSALSALSLAIGLISFGISSYLKGKSTPSRGSSVSSMHGISDDNIPSNLHKTQNFLPETSLKTLPIFFLAGLLASYLSHYKQKES
jgi:hypothetical protein